MTVDIIIINFIIETILFYLYFRYFVTIACSEKR